ncbi:NAD-glutamate dehydrogenase [Stakelama tenebrarum]|uniref:NAD-glutamate dehydrogenase n=1 Tax=Stakelama tenebrarum TaxID=2711215 RepID=A0A6G6Y3P3_9SPHN|nr:NAD-glutamate dehydrogenase domain-containing protein [Sphingosinithalassobacter tenebrarum]QIG79338.1 NAD-glutamate dehydrogenase [Sphingosinithalassobacter tenebrarum]
MTKNTLKTLAAELESHLTDGALPGELEGFDEEARAEAAQFLAKAAVHRRTGDSRIEMATYLADGRRRMRLAVANDDMPFLVDSIASAIAAHDIVIHRIIHPIIPVTRDKDGTIVKVGEGHPESMIYIEMERGEARLRRALAADIERTLDQVRDAVSDWPELMRAMAADIERIESEEGAALVRWFHDGKMTLLGHERWARDGSASDQLGLCRYTLDVPILAESSRAAALQWFEEGGEAPLLLKSNAVSPVHRRVPLDLVVVPLRDDDRITGLSIHAGLWTSAAMHTQPRDVPVLRTRLGMLERKFGFDPAGHTGKAMQHALQSLPHDLITAFPAEALETLAMTAMSVADRPRSKLVLIRSALGRHLFAFVWLPRDEVSTGHRTAIGGMLTKAAHARLINWSIALEDGVVALIRYTLDLRDGGVMPDAQALDNELEHMMRGWVPAVEAALSDRVGQRATRLALRYAGAFPSAYRDENDAEEAALDILRLCALSGTDARSVRICPVPGRRDMIRVKLYRLGGALALSDAVPVFENFGFHVVEEVPTRLTDGTEAYVHDFEVSVVGGIPDAIRDDPKVVEDAIAAVLEGRAENDSFNRLIVEAGVSPASVVLFRAWFRYLRQTGLSYGLSTVVDALRRAPKVAAALIERFAIAHDPSRQPADEEAIARADRAIASGLDEVSAIDDDRILRTFSGVIGATLRTNAYAAASEEALAFKLDSAQVPGLPKPLPWREIFVYSPRVEGVHLRAGPVARGGLRWSDRRDDFRTEILGLMKAQRVKNAVIVPTGAKGGFYPKQLPDPRQDRDAWFEEGKESYRIFIRALLSVTDNIVKGEVVHPDDVTILDDDDPYFVVAADKGTATFSDVANAIAIDRGFWLGDAFASGGSHGYDHKAMAITARGAWVSVQRHFLEMGIDVQSEPVRVAGCGDMSGDVFGNGMLLSKAIKLVAAFDHRHIFLDPDPDPAKSWDERKRMFDLPRSSWDDYDRSLISKGGGVFARTEKSIPLTPEIRELLGIDAKELDPSALISAILRAPVDLLWFGGIGTYIKSSDENNVEVGDPANDRLRVDANMVRAKAVGEGANLGVTQAGRIEFAAAGGRINTDFIDNSAGVDCSDNEVNIKIALNREMNEGDLKFEERNKLLAQMTDDVAALVLEDNRLQTLALSFMENDGARALRSYVRVIEILEASGRLDRAVEGLAANDDLLRRAQEGRGLTRPELAVLLATAKLALQDAVEACELGKQELLEPDLYGSFPTAMRERFPKAIAEHRLRGEIVATKLANRIINRLGVLHPFELAEEEGAAMGDIASMFIVAERLFGLQEIWEAIETGEMSEEARIALFDEVAVGARSQIADLLRTVRPGEAASDVIERLEKGIANLDRQAKDLLLEEVRTQSGRISEKLESAGAPAELAARVVRLFELDGAVGLADLGERQGIDETVLTRAFTHLGQVLGLDWAQANAARVYTGDPWERLLIASLARDFQQLRLDFLARREGKDPEAAVDAWLEDQADRVDQFVKLVERAKLAASPSAAMLAQIAGQARVLLAR